jgi:hypothetical protein
MDFRYEFQIKCVYKEEFAARKVTDLISDGIPGIGGIVIFVPRCFLFLFISVFWKRVATHESGRFNGQNHA